MSGFTCIKLAVPAVSIQSGGEGKGALVEVCCGERMHCWISVSLLDFRNLHCHEQWERSLTSSVFLCSGYSPEGMPFQCSRSTDECLTFKSDGKGSSR